MIFDDILNVAGHRAANGEILSDALLTKNSSKSYPVPNWDAAWELARRKNQVQNIVVLKIMFHYTAYLSAAISGALPAESRPSLRFMPELFDAFRNFFRDAIWVLVERRDVFAQAVSMYFAATTKLWEIRRESVQFPVEAPPNAPYDRARLLNHLRWLVTERAQWPHFFVHYKISPLRLNYEDAVDNYPEYLDDVFAATGLTRANRLAKRRLLKIGNANNAYYARLLRDDVLLDLYRRMSESDQGLLELDVEDKWI